MRSELTGDLFANTHGPEPEILGPGIVLLRGFALASTRALREDITSVTAQSPFRHMMTPGGFEMSVAMTNCGRLGWISDRQGYRYDRIDPQSGEPWPSMPASFARLAHGAAHAAGFPDFAADACLINRYVAGSRLSMHQDRDERDLDQPIVSVSLGVPATFLLGGFKRTDRIRRLPLFHGDIIVWGGPSRLIFHGVQPLKLATHAFMGAERINLTFRRAR